MVVGNCLRRNIPFSLFCWRLAATVLLGLSITACTDTLNNPHPPHSEQTNTLFVPFSGRSPKYLDPASSYSNDETPYNHRLPIERKAEA